MQFFELNWELEIFMTRKPISCSQQWPPTGSGFQTLCYTVSYSNFAVAADSLVTILFLPN